MRKEVTLKLNDGVEALEDFGNSDVLLGIQWFARPGD